MECGLVKFYSLGIFGHGFPEIVCVSRVGQSRK